MLEDRSDSPAAPELRVEVRGLRPEDFDAVVTIDERNVGRRREEAVLEAERVVAAAQVVAGGPLPDEGHAIHGDLERGCEPEAQRGLHGEIPDGGMPADALLPVLDTGLDL